MGENREAREQVGKKRVEEEKSKNIFSSVKREMAWCKALKFPLTFSATTTNKQAISS
jgi:hypothetical protein